MERDSRNLSTVVHATHWDTFLFLLCMETMLLDCGSLMADAGKMVRSFSREERSDIVQTGSGGMIRLSMNALVVKYQERTILVDPGVADFLPGRITRQYGIEFPASLEDQLSGMSIGAEQVTDVIFTHLHFDHGSGAFRRIPGGIVKRFPEANYHVLREHYEYALRPDPAESDSFFTLFLKYLDRIHWLEEWNDTQIRFKVYNGHTRGMAVPVIKTGDIETCFASDLVPMKIFLQHDIYSGYDLDPETALREKREFLKGLKRPCRLIMFHDSLQESVLYP